MFTQPLIPYFKITKRNTLKGIFVFILCCQIAACGSKQNTKALDAKYLHQWNIKLEACIIEDSFSPPVAARIYAYSNIAAYEILQLEDNGYESFSKMIRDFPEIPAKDKNIHSSAAACFAFYFVGDELVYANHLANYLVEFEQQLLKEQLSPQTIKASKEYGEKVAKVILGWASKDNYKETRSDKRYVLLETEGSWEPTPPDYMDALEPNWNKMRPFILDSASQFSTTLPAPFDLKKGSEFYEEVHAVYEVVKNPTKEKMDIANYWDDSPLVLGHDGHATVAIKQLTPGGHWMNIGRVCAQKTNYGMMESGFMYAVLSMGLYESFIAAWDLKYATDYIRPVTIIKKEIDPDWMPLLVTPNFPEYPSGHSVISRTSAELLTHLFGENVGFVDSAEVFLWKQTKSFDSFYAAADEAGISRFYGGIHFMSAIEDGRQMGNKIGLLMIDKMKLIHKK